MDDVLRRVALTLRRAGIVSALALATASLGCAAGDSTGDGFTPPEVTPDSGGDGHAGTGGTTGQDAAPDQGPDVSPDVSTEDASDADASVEDASVDGQAEGGDEDASADAPVDVDPDADPDACWNQVEICDGLDNNCNGSKDENDPGGGEPCQVPNKLGVCAEGTTHCQNGVIKCTQNTPASAEICDDLDNNCDGVVDNNPTDVGGSCNTGNQGVCAAGTEKCASGAVICEQNLQPSTEVCNGLDDNCDGTPDDGFAGAGDPCTVPNQPVNTPCAQGKTNCLSGQDKCTQTYFPSVEVCDGIDNDCNGTIDDPAYVDGKVCDTHLAGECSKGKTQCAGGMSECIPNVNPGEVPETCNAKDDDCNGAVDDVPNIKLECATKFSSAQNVSDWACSVAGTCQVVACAGAYADCDLGPANGCEVNTLNSTLHCGACDHGCSTNHGTPTCQLGTCQIACNLGWGNCDGDPANGCETSTTDSVDSCGACGHQCDATTGTPTCVNSQCSIVCSPGLGNCDNDASNGCETPLSTDPLHCGTCLKVCSSVGGVASCTGGQCGIACDAANADCNTNIADGCEISLLTDPLNCGGCGNKCSTNHGTPSCNGGLCQIACAPGFGDCNNDPSDGCETDLTTTASSCGACGAACDATHGTASCVGGACQIACDSSWGNCDNNVTNGCETDLLSSAANCTACGTACSTNHATPACVNGACQLTSCATNWGDCDHDPANGCEADFKNDELNCGACTVQCSTSGGTPSCNNGICGIACTAPNGDCDGNPSNGCETNTSNNVLNCGGCSLPCSTNHATPTCVSSQCLLACTAPWENCDGVAANGCEADLANDPLHCGLCVKQCSGINGTPGCSSGSCTIACNAGYGNCDNIADNGCETNLNTDLNNCSSCGHQCNLPNATALCTNGACVISACATGFQDCDGVAANGCEVNLKTDPNNCNGCGHICNSTNGTASCNAGTCEISCNSGWGNCANGVADGCETNLLTDVNNCSACGAVCPLDPGHVTSRTCASGQCTITSCEAGYYDQNNTFSGGCECREEQPNVLNTCASATPLGNVALNQTITKTGNLSPTTTDTDWYVVNFAIGPSCDFNPSITITAGDGVARFHIYTSCSNNTITCAEGQSSKADLTQWNMNYASSTVCGTYWNPGYFNHPDGPGAAAFVGLPNSGGYFTAYIEVYASADTATCGSYTLTITD